jgi:hypothetical protein
VTLSGGAQLSGTLALTVVPWSVTVPEATKMPPPSMLAVFPLTVLPISVARPRLKMPPPFAPAVLWLTVLSDSLRVVAPEVTP